MKGATVPSSDHILRLISFQHVEEDGSIMGGGFISRPSENNMPSYNWMECFEGSISDQVASIRKRARIRYGGTGANWRSDLPVYFAGFPCSRMSAHAIHHINTLGLIWRTWWTHIPIVMVLK